MGSHKFATLSTDQFSFVMGRIEYYISYNTELLYELENLQEHITRKLIHINYFLIIEVSKDS